MIRAGRLRRGVAGDAAGERKPPEQLHAFRVGWHVGVALRVGVPQCPSSRSPGSSRSATTRRPVPGRPWTPRAPSASCSRSGSRPQAATSRKGRDQPPRRLHRGSTSAHSRVHSAALRTASRRRTVIHRPTRTAQPMITIPAAAVTPSTSASRPSGGEETTRPSRCTHTRADRSRRRPADHGHENGTLLTARIEIAGRTQRLQPGPVRDRAVTHQHSAHGRAFLLSNPPGVARVSADSHPCEDTRQRRERAAAVNAQAAASSRRSVRRRGSRSVRDGCRSCDGCITLASFSRRDAATSAVAGRRGRPPGTSVREVRPSGQRAAPAVGHVPSPRHPDRERPPVVASAGSPSRGTPRAAHTPDSPIRAGRWRLRRVRGDRRRAGRLLSPAQFRTSAGLPSRLVQLDRHSPPAPEPPRRPRRPSGARGSGDPT